MSPFCTRRFKSKHLEETKDVSLPTYLATLLFFFFFFWKSEDPKSKESKGHSSACEMAAGIMLFVALLRKVSDPKSAEVVRGYCSHYSWGTFGKGLWNKHSCHKRDVQIPGSFLYRMALAAMCLLGHQSVLGEISVLVLCPLLVGLFAFLPFIVLLSLLSSFSYTLFCIIKKIISLSPETCFISAFHCHRVEVEGFSPCCQN